MGEIVTYNLYTTLNSYNFIQWFIKNTHKSQQSVITFKINDFIETVSHSAEQNIINIRLKNKSKQII